jgi:hypothetical protein
VCDAWEKATKTKSDIMWRRLVDHAGDARYALTGDNDDFESWRTKNFTVGSLCYHIASTDLGAPYLRHLEGLEVAEWRIVPEAVFKPHDEFWSHKEKWADKPLYQIQIAVCRRAIEQMASATGIRAANGNDSPARTFTAKEKTWLIESVKSEIQQLERTQKATVSPDIRLPGFNNRQFTAERGKAARHLYLKHGKKQDKDNEQR